MESTLHYYDYERSWLGFIHMRAQTCMVSFPASRTMVLGSVCPGPFPYSNVVYGSPSISESLVSVPVITIQKNEPFFFTLTQRFCQRQKVSRVDLIVRHSIFSKASSTVRRFRSRVLYTANRATWINSPSESNQKINFLFAH